QPHYHCFNSSQKILLSNQLYNLIQTRASNTSTMTEHTTPHQVLVHTTTRSTYDTAVTPQQGRSYDTAFTPQQRYEGRSYDTALTPQQRYEGRVTHYSDKTPSTSQVLAVIAGLPVGGILLALSGLSFLGTLTGLALATPLFILFSPILVPATIIIGLAVAGFLTSGAFGLTALSSFSWVVNYIRQTQGTVPEQLESAKYRLADMASYVGQKTKEAGQKTKEVGQEIQSKAQESKQDIQAKAQESKRTSATAATTTTGTTAAA
ncbi:oleosin Ara h 10.0101-like, partial [Vicia villosa]|uniref:oleosin Ara h 10.0101-like n=1 Tax=Vicia villosa TaxID=3911 RepID=UPI00273B8E6D